MEKFKANSYMNTVFGQPYVKGDAENHYFRYIEAKINELIEKVNELEEKLKENKMKATPLFRRILVQVVDKVDTSPGGIIIPDAAKEKPTEALVVAVGSGCTEVKVGDKVLFSKYAGNEIMIGDVAHLVLQEEDVQVRLED